MYKKPLNNSFGLPITIFGTQIALIMSKKLAPQNYHSSVCNVDYSDEDYPLPFNPRRTYAAKVSRLATE